MSDRPWYKRYPADFIAATLQMNLEQKGAYSMILDIMYDRGGSIPDDSQWIARVCGCSTRKWNQIRKYLIENGKIKLSQDKLTNKRVEKELKVGEQEHEKLSKNGEKGAKKTNKKRVTTPKNNNIDEKGPVEIDPQGPDGAERHRARVPEARDYIERGSGDSGEDVGVKPDLDAIGACWREACEIAGADPDKDVRYAVFSDVANWMRQGFDPELDILPTVRAVMLKRDGPPGSLAYFTKAIAENHARRKAGAPLPDIEAGGGGIDPNHESAAEHWRLKHFLKTGDWRGNAGEEPEPEAAQARLAALSGVALRDMPPIPKRMRVPPEPAA